MRIVDAGFASGLFYRSQNVFGADVADQVVSGEGAAAESGECAIEAAASGPIGGENFRFGVFRAAVEMSAQFYARDVLVRSFKHLSNNFWGGIACGVGKRNGPDANVFQPLESFFDELGAPGFVVGIAERHGNIDYKTASGGFSFFVQSFDESAGFAARHVSVGPAEGGGDGIRIAGGIDTGSRKRALQSFFCYA